MARKADRQLTAPQMVAAEMVAQGHTDQEAGEAAGVTRQTVNEWRRSDPLFVATVNAIRRDLWHCGREKLRAMGAKAMGVVDAALDGGSLPAALAVLKTLRALPEPGGPVTVDGALRSFAERAVSEAEESTPMDDSEKLGAMLFRADRVKAMMQKMGSGA